MFSTKIRTVLAIATVAVAAMTFGISAASADAAVGPLSASLTITKAGNGYSSVLVTGVVKATPAETQEMLRKDYRVVFRLWGSDTFSDDFLYGPDPASVVATSRGLEFKGQAVVRNSVLDEDWGVDEVYAGVRLVTWTSYTGGKLRHGPTIVSGQSNEVWRSF
ncbi:MAG: hypothetical protein QOE65_2164 [Solirubrobacteraceae bacterium]|jgi:hypothetical protein|nr:hypothetical protein [Solirubrobacteraceae bacterium]